MDRIPCSDCFATGVVEWSDGTKSSCPNCGAAGYLVPGTPVLEGTSFRVVVVDEYASNAELSDLVLREQLEAPDDVRAMLDGPEPRMVGLDNSTSTD